MSYVYLVRHATEPRFKIGKADDPFLRSKSFGENLDLESSLQIHLGHRAYGIEKGLHAIFDAYRLPPVSANDGATEWFQLECWDQCLAFFNQHNDLIGALPGSIPKPAPTSVTVLTAEEKAERRQRRLETERRRIQEENTEDIERWEQLLPWLDLHEIAEERIDQYGRLNILLSGVPEVEARAFVSGRVGWSRLLTHVGSYCCGIESVEWCESVLTLNLRRLDPDVFEMATAVLDPDLRGRFEAMDAWLVAHIEGARVHLGRTQTD